MKTPGVTILVLGVLLTGCYHAAIDIGGQPAPQAIKNSLASGSFFGLIPAGITSNGVQCPEGVSNGQIRPSFINQLFSFLSAVVVGPMAVSGTCTMSE